MKLFTTLLSFLIVSTALSQHFVLDGQPKKIYANYSSPTVPMSTLGNKYVIHGKDEMEITDISTGKIVFEWDPKGVYGTSYVSPDGKWIANRSQNYEDPQLGNVDVYQVLNTETKKEYFRTNPDELWSTTGFANSKKEVAVQVYNLDDHKTRLVVYDFENDNIIKTLYTSDKSSTVILAIAYSPDDQLIYATIATNALISYLYVFDRATGERVGKTTLKHQANHIFVTPDKIVVSGAHGDHATEYTTVISPKDYSIVEDWKGKAIDNLDPTHTYSIIYDWDTKMLQTFNIKTGKKTDLLDGSDLNLYPLSCAFTKDGNYFAIAKNTPWEERKTKQPGEFDVLYVLNNQLIEDPVVEETETTTTETETNSNNTTVNNASANGWISYKHPTPNFAVSLPSAAKVKEEKNKSGNNTITVTAATQTEAGIVSAIEIPKIKGKKYATLAQKMGEDFIKKKSPTNVKKYSYSYNDQEGVQYTFKIDKFEYVYRAFCFEGYAYQLIYLAPELDKKNYSNFFDTFKIK